MRTVAIKGFISLCGPAIKFFLKERTSTCIKISKK